MAITTKPDIVSKACKCLHGFINQVLRFFLQLGSAQCIKCMLGVVHKRCEAHRYIRVGGGYRHSYSYLKAVFDELEATLGHDPLNLGRLAAIHEACKLLDLILTLTLVQ